MNHIEIAGKSIGNGHPCFVIAEAGVNHNGDVALAKRLIDVAVASGADAVKFQTFNSEMLVAPTAPKAEYQIDSNFDTESQKDMLRNLELSNEDFASLETYARESGVIFLSTPFDHGSVDLLDKLGLPAFKIGSGEVGNIPLIKHISSKGKPVILSTGMSYLNEVARAVSAFRDSGNHNLVLLHCVSAYPTQPNDVNLKAMETLEQAFEVPIGFSDHTQGLEVPFAAVAMGAKVIEKHFTLDRNMTGPDHKASLEPDMLRRMVDGIRTIEQAIGNGIKEPTDSEQNIRAVAHRSIYIRNSIIENTILSEDDLVCLRPSGGIPPHKLHKVVGKHTLRPLRAGTLLNWSDIK